MDNVETLDIPGAKGLVQVQGTLGVFFRILVDGQVLKPVKGRWLIPSRKGDSIELRQRGFLAGFQTLVAGGQPVYRLGAHVPVWLRVIMFVPLLLIILNPLMGLILGVALFFSNIMIVKNPQMPLGLRAALPIVNAAAVAVIILVLTGQLG